MRHEAVLRALQDWGLWRINQLKGTNDRLRDKRKQRSLTVVKGFGSDIRMDTPQWTLQ